MRRGLWTGFALLLLCLSFLAGRTIHGSPSLPAIVATLQGDEREFSREFDERIRERFAIGTSEDALVAYLMGAQFFPTWRRRDEPNVALFVWSGLLCTKTVRVNWRADSSGALTEVHGAYDSQCQ